MKNYMAIWYQQGGCDYTIGCGIAVYTFEALDLDAATAHVVDELSDLDLSSDVADSITKVQIYETMGSGTVLTPDTWMPSRSEREQGLSEDKERSEYERLRKKFDR